MTRQAFTPALGRFAPTRFYDPVVMLTRERLWRALTVMHAAPRPYEVIVDVGCGTGSTALLLHRIEPRARVVAVDPDREVLAIARRKAEAAGATVRWETGMGDALPDRGPRRGGHGGVHPGVAPMPGGDEAGRPLLDARGAAAGRQARHRRLRATAHAADAAGLPAGAVRRRRRGHPPERRGPAARADDRSWSAKPLTAAASAGVRPARSSSTVRRSRPQTRQRVSGIPQLVAGQAAQPLRGYAHPRGQIPHRDRPGGQRVHRGEQPGSSSPDGRAPARRTSSSASSRR